MKTLHCYQTFSVLRFRYWSRKRYAAFCSLGRVVTIGTLNKSVTEASLKKQNGVILSDACVWTELKSEREEEDSGGGLDSFLEMNVWSLRSQVTRGESNCCYYKVFWQFWSGVRYAGNSFTCIPFLLS